MDTAASPAASRERVDIFTHYMLEFLFAKARSSKWSDLQPDVSRNKIMCVSHFFFHYFCYIFIFT